MINDFTIRSNFEEKFMDLSETILDQFFESYKPRKKKEKSSKEEKITELEIKELTTKKTDFLLSVEYDGKNSCAAARFYDPRNHSIYFWHDCSDHHPYCFSNISIEDLKNNSKITNHTGFLDMETVEKKDLLLDKSVKMTKIIAKDPLAIGGKTGAIRELLPTAWEANIPYHKCYIADLALTPGLPYEVFDEQLNSAAIVPVEIKEEINQLFEDEPKEVKELLEKNMPLFLSPIPDIKRVAIDIEVISPFADAIPRPEQANYPVGCVSVVASDGQKRILLLERKDVEIGDAKDNLEDVSIEYFTKEKELFQELFQVFNEYPVILTYNGDKFDMPYLYYRALNHLGFRRDEIPMIIRKDFVALSKNIHVDLYRFFNNRAVQIYAFSAKYKTTDLNTVANALLGMEKIKVEQPLLKLPLLDLASYCYRDGKITLNLTRYSENLVWKLIILLMRISHLSLEDVTRQSVSSWIQNLFYYEHRKNDYLIPLPNEIKEAKGEEASTQAIIKGKKYKGAIVIDPLPGVHFDVVVLDFASLYPSIIKVHNLSYETVRCTHPECKQNLIPGTDHWVCKKQRGLAGLIIGFLRDIRLKWFKPQSKNKMLGKETQELYYVIQQALKLIINAFYGVFGAEHFPLYCLPVAESTTALGRFIITQTIEKAQKMDISVIYGDTDSVFLENPSESQIEKLTQWCKQTLDIELDIDKIYRYVALSERKKNYVGVYRSGSVDIKGLTGKKRHTPLFLQDAFFEMMNVLSEVKVQNDFEIARNKIRTIVKTCLDKLKNLEYSLEELAFRVQMTRNLKSYQKTTPQHVKAARLLNRDIEPGSIISFVKVRGEPGVKPVEIASIDEIDTEKYKKHVESIFTQVLDALNVDFGSIIGIRRLDLFM